MKNQLSIPQPLRFQHVFDAENNNNKIINI